MWINWEVLLVWSMVSHVTTVRCSLDLELSGGQTEIAHLLHGASSNNPSSYSGAGFQYGGLELPAIAEMEAA